MNFAKKLLLCVCVLICSCSKTPIQEDIKITEEQKQEKIIKKYINEALLVEAKKEKNTILVLLPLTGPHASIGASLSLTCNLAIKNHIDELNSDTEFKFIDTEDKENTPLKIYKAYKNKKILAIIGPLFANDVKKWSILFQDIPLLSLSNNIGINNKHVYCCGVTPEDEIKTILQFMTLKKMSNILILLPKTSFGDLLLKAIKKAANMKDFDEDSSIHVIRYTEEDIPNIEDFIKSSNKEAIFAIEPILNKTKIKSAQLFTLSSCALANLSDWNSAIFAYADNDNQQHFIKEYFSLTKKYPTIIDIVTFDVVYATLTTNGQVNHHKFTGCLGDFIFQKNRGIRRNLQLFLVQNNSKIDISDEYLTPNEYSNSKKTQKD